MRIVVSAARLMLALMAVAQAALAFEIEDHAVFPASPERSVLRIISTADLDVFRPILLAFQAENPGVTLDYTITGTSQLMAALHEEGASFDLAISSAMDLQTKLANDGFAQAHASPAAETLPDWAAWRNEVFGFTQEPAVIIVSRAFFGDDDVPQNREELIRPLRGNPDRFRGKIGTYDVRPLGFGYLVATQDSRRSEAFWRLMEVMGSLEARLYCCSGEMIRDVAKGRLALAYNVLGSYAAAELRRVGGFEIVEPTDFVNVMLRSALIPKSAANPGDARRMVDFLLTLAAASGLPAIDPDALRANSALHPIRFGPGLLVFLDRMTRDSFLNSWESSLFQVRGLP
ncbi:ABC transporter substrate-binding protein [Jhaorihella thermophila]|uniref:Iron(III) transport system substrate-binding protein n=1 Tax=Jhaorihella thermophila TaxID=488547 RepID=A0A1H5TL27_9RHOB|nr:ABC transporter substrate-binding protein [Jhaorihella thermophila]SEF62821.1 iron(III) transport system substrate-binding protein [Jhaorihella thermophila]